MGKTKGSLRTLSSDEISDLNRRSAFKISPEKRTERARKMGESSVRGLTPEQLLARMCRANAGMSSEERSELGRRIIANRSYEDQVAYSRQGGRAAADQGK